MKHSTVIGLATVALMACPALVLAADQVPDIKGKWIGKTYSIVAGRGGHWPSSKATFEKPGLFEKDLVIEVTGQEDRRFWGIQTLSGGGEKTEEPFVGELTGKDNHEVVMADTDGYLKGRSTATCSRLLCAGGRQSLIERREPHRDQAGTLSRFQAPR